MSTLEEWKAAREQIDKFEERIHDLRKHGFSFVSALVTADAFLLHGLKDGPLLELAVFGTGVVAWILVLAIRYTERRYQLLQAAAAGRAVVIERHLGLELTEHISDRGKIVRWRADSSTVTMLLSGCVFVVLVSTLHERMYQVAATIAFVAVVWELRRVSARRLDVPAHVIDWSLSATECRVGDRLRFSANNLNRFTPHSFKKNEVIWELLDHAGSVARSSAAGPEGLTIKELNCYLWEIDTADLTPGLYTMTISPGRQMRRRLHVLPAPPGPPNSDRSEE